MMIIRVPKLTTRYTNGNITIIEISRHIGRSGDVNPGLIALLSATLPTQILPLISYKTEVY